MSFGGEQRGWGAYTFGSASNKWGEGLYKAVGAMNDMTAASIKWVKTDTVKKMNMGGAAFGAIAKSLKTISSVGLDALGMFIQMGNSMGIIQPIMQMLQGVLAIMGGAAFEAMGDTLTDFAEFLFSSDMIEFWEELGTVIGNFLKWLMEGVMEWLGNPAVRKAILHVVMTIGKLLMHLANIFAIFFGILMMLPTGVLGSIIIAIAAFSALIQGMNALPGIAGVILGVAMAAGVAIALAPLAGLAEGGIVTRPTLAMIGEGGEPEMVTPLSKAGDFGFGGSGDQMLWATEDNGRKMDRLVMAIEEQNRLKRLKYL